MKKAISSLVIITIITGCSPTSKQSSQISESYKTNYDFSTTKNDSNQVPKDSVFISINNSEIFTKKIIKNTNQLIEILKENEDFQKETEGFGGLGIGVMQGVFEDYLKNYKSFTLSITKNNGTWSPEDIETYISIIKQKSDEKNPQFFENKAKDFCVQSKLIMKSDTLGNFLETQKSQIPAEINLIISEDKKEFNIYFSECSAANKQEFNKAITTFQKYNYVFAENLPKTLFTSLIDRALIEKEAYLKEQFQEDTKDLSPKLIKTIKQIIKDLFSLNIWKVHYDQKQSFYTIQANESGIITNAAIKIPNQNSRTLKKEYFRGNIMSSNLFLHKESKQYFSDEENNETLYIHYQLENPNWTLFISKYLEIYGDLLVPIFATGIVAGFSTTMLQKQETMAQNAYLQNQEILDQQLLEIQELENQVLSPESSETAN